MLEVLLGHMGGPFWARKDEGAWSIVKGELAEGEDPLAGARREFAEELGHPPPEGEVLSLGEIRQKAGKRVIAFAVEGDFDPASLVAGTFEMQWPPRSGRRATFPELDRVAWFDLKTAPARSSRARSRCSSGLGMRFPNPGDGSRGPSGTDSASQIRQRRSSSTAAVRACDRR